MNSTELNGLKNLVQTITSTSLSNVLKETWTDENMQRQFMYTKARDLEMQDAMTDYQKQLQRQVRFTGGSNLSGGYVAIDPNVPSNQMYGLRLDMFPSAVRERKARQSLLMQHVAAVKRGGKPSYRQRQKNGRKARQG